MRRREAAEVRADMSDGEGSGESRKSVRSVGSDASHCSEKSCRSVPSPSPRPGRPELPAKMRMVTLGQETVKVFKPGSSVEDSRRQEAVVGELRTGTPSQARKDALKRTRTIHPGAAALAKARLIPPKGVPPVRKGGKNEAKGKGKSSGKAKSSRKGKAKGKGKGKKK